MNRPMSEMSSERDGIWGAVRRTLGRLVGTVRVRELSAAWLIPMPTLSVTQALTQPSPAAGNSEAYWRPEALTTNAPLPQVRPGASGTGLAVLTSVIGSGNALSPAGGRVHAAALPTALCTVHRLAGDDLPAWPPPVHREAVTLSPGTVSSPVVCLAAPGTACLSTDAPTLPREVRRLWPGRRSVSDDLLSPTGGRVRSALSVAAEVPLTRGRRPVPPGVAAGEAFAAERQRLAEAVGVAEDDAVLLGIFPQVPVAAVRRLALEESGVLSLWLKPEALAAAAVGRVPRLATLIIGRQRSTGKIIQTVA